MQIGAYITAGEVIKTICHRNGDMAMSRAAIYATFMTTVFNELRLDVTHKSVIRKYYLNKATNSLPIPDDCLLLLAVGYEDKCGVVQPLWYNADISLDLLFSNNKNCDCNTCGGEHAYCGLIKDFDTETEAITINGTDYTKTVKRTTLIDGTIIEKITEPVLNSDDTVTMTTTENELCKVDLLPCGCVAKTEANTKTLDNLCCGGCASITTNCGKYNRYIPKEKGYRLDMNESQVIVDPSYPYDYIVLRYVTTIKSQKDYRIPAIALEAMVYGIMYYSNSFDKKLQMGDRSFGGNWYQLYQAEKMKLSKNINPINYAKALGAMGITKGDRCHRKYRDGYGYADYYDY